MEDGAPFAVLPSPNRGCHIGAGNILSFYGRFHFYPVGDGGGVRIGKRDVEIAEGDRFHIVCFHRIELVLRGVGAVAVKSHEARVQKFREVVRFFLLECFPGGFFLRDERSLV